MSGWDAAEKGIGKLRDFKEEGIKIICKLFKSYDINPLSYY